MRVLWAVVAVTLSCMPLSFANGQAALSESEADIIVVPPETEPVTTEPTPAVVPGAGPAPIATSVTTIPVSVPVLIHRNVLYGTTQEQWVTVLVPATVDANASASVLANNQMAVVMAPVSLPVVASQAVNERVIQGAGPCPVRIDQRAVNRIAASPALTVLTLSSPIQVDQTLLNKINTGQPVLMQQTSFSKIARVGQPVLAVPLTTTVTAPTGVIAGRGPAISAPLSATEANRVLSTGTIMVAMTVDRNTLGNLVTDNTVQMVVPMMVPVVVTPQTLTTPTMPR